MFVSTNLLTGVTTAKDDGDLSWLWTVKAIDEMGTEVSDHVALDDASFDGAALGRHRHAM